MGDVMAAYIRTQHEAETECRKLRELCAVLVDALGESESVCASINKGKQHKLEREDDDPVFWQTSEWVQWASEDVLKTIRQAIAAAAEAGVK